jgi:hypothetical protein
MHPRRQRASASNKARFWFLLHYFDIASETAQVVFIWLAARGSHDRAAGGSVRKATCGPVQLGSWKPFKVAVSRTYTQREINCCQINKSGMMIRGR